MYKQDIFWNNIPYTKGRIGKKLGFLADPLYKNSFLKKLKNPYFIWTGTGRIHSLEKMLLGSKTKNLSKNLEFHFYLYEPTCFRIGDYNRSFYSEFDSSENLKDLISDEIDSVLIFVKNNDIQHFKIFTSDYNVQLIKNNYPNVNIQCLDLFLRDISSGYINFPNLTNTIEKKFWCGNWRYTAHRHIVMSYLSSLEGTYTWNLNCSYQELEKNNWFDLKKFKEDDPKRYQQLSQGISYLQNNIFSIDQNIDSVEVKKFEDVFIPGHTSPNWSTKFLYSYRNNFCAVVNETRFAQPFGYFSEKTITAISSKLPIILVAPPRSLEYLKMFGFKTFDRWWDEGYDLEENHYKRMLKIFEVIDYINSKSLDDLREMYSDMKETLEYNHKVIMTIPLNDVPL